MTPGVSVIWVHRDTAGRATLSIMRVSWRTAADDHLRTDVLAQVTGVVPLA